MGNFLANIRYVAWGALGVGAVFLLYMWLGYGGYSTENPFFWDAIFRWLHVLSGIMWIGHLYYFNFTQIPNVPKIPEEHRGPAIAKVIAPAALFWFRWGAVATLVTGLIVAYTNGYLVHALVFGADEEFSVKRHTFIGIGMWLAIIMFFNVWAIIWPNQQKALGIGAENASLDPAVKAKAARTAMLFSRTNTFLSVPMLVAMTGAQAFA
ncbi:MAG TPA: urate hydroxylase PuuD [Caulobacterales bacterium]|nr:urate hydroxylase PuuD [Caulobacterales bacterium]